MHAHMSGVYTALVTPFRDDGKFDEPAMRNLVERQVEAGVSGVVACGTTGEAAALTDEEHQRVVACVVESVGGRITVVAGSGTNSLHHTRELSRRCMDAGADALLQVTPYYIKPTQAGLADYFRGLADAFPIPQILYNVPGRTGVNLQPATVLELAGHPRIQALKQAVTDLEVLNDMLYQRPSRFAVLSGEDALMLPMIALGADGVISVVSNLFPREIKALVAAALRGDRASAIAWQATLHEAMRGNFLEPNPIPVKFALWRMGLVENRLRAPLTPLSAHLHVRIEHGLREAGWRPRERTARSYSVVNQDLEDLEYPSEDRNEPTPQVREVVHG